MALQCLQLRSWEELREEKTHTHLARGRWVFLGPKKGNWLIVFAEQQVIRWLSLSFFLVFTPGRGEHLIGFLRSR